MKKTKKIPAGMHYSQLVDQAVRFPLKKQHHATLRTCFDPYSAEWHQTSMDTKISILKKVVTHGIDLANILSQFKISYRNSPASTDAVDGLAKLLQHVLVKKVTKKKTVKK